MHRTVKWATKLITQRPIRGINNQLRGITMCHPPAIFIAAFVLVMPSILMADDRADKPKTDATASAAATNSENTGTAAKWPAEIWVRPVKVEIDEDSSLRTNDTYNHPPKVFVVCKKNGVSVGECPSHKGWSVEFPVDDYHEFLIDDSADQYTIEVWDSQSWSNKVLFSIGPMKGSEWRQKLTNPASKQLEEGRVATFQHEDKHESISLSFAGTRMWYRLVNATIPPDSPHRKDTNLNQPPRLQVGLKTDGEHYGDTSSRDKGWSVDFPKVTSNCWAVREGTKRRYTVELWDNQYGFYSSKLICAVTGLSAEQFRQVIREDVGTLITKDRAVSITFERIEKPF
jgi:hypothetical protein